MAQSPLNDTTQPVDNEEEGRKSTMDKQWLIKRKNTSAPMGKCSFIEHLTHKIHIPSQLIRHLISDIQNVRDVL